MDASRFDTVSRLFAQRRLSRREALSRAGVAVAGGAALAAGLGSAEAGSALAQEATPPSGDADKIQFLFVQSFQSGSIAPKEGADGRFTLSLQQGLGSTIYFSDRPARIAGAAPTDKFLAGLGFLEDNPPNAALVISSPDGTTDIAVLELFNPVFDPASPGVTYEVAALAEWEISLEMGFSEQPADLSSFDGEFGSSHLLIDDCPDWDLWCVNYDEQEGAKLPGVYGSCFNWSDLACRMCSSKSYYQSLCSQHFPDICSGSPACELAHMAGGGMLEDWEFAS